MLQHELDSRGVATLCLDRPQLHNAFDDTLIAELNRVLTHYAADPAVRVLVLRSNGKSFSAGADLNWMKRVAQYDFDDNLRDSQALAELMERIYRFPAPTVAVVQGPAFGGGVGLVSCCDIAIASTSASFCLSEVKLGLAPAVISPYVIAAMGARQAQRYFLTAERFSADTACQTGLVQQVVAPEVLDDEADTLVNALLANGPVALAACKQLIHRVAEASTPEIRDYTTHLIATLRAGAEGQEGLKAFLDKRPANWIPTP
ncbi:methylglutaconyl-CoA hydratase [Fluviicoccus keumensis]|uniref:Methylglutaconyl-CoA hydratase n=1 Tax=Fluviicoccus keumensis TaxID=1435465 RepID=A0A4Q7Z5Q5_9GAMM|nr:enoyl-CoA hydratase-related protein [Fluviicoccus keumensis]RZU44995.1 methylglutaconyl-CoA hydratase [Fluviicoccus keumensis]